ncbi:MAG: pitrilysin family protein [Nanoarchaeota archaeon]
MEKALLPNGLTVFYKKKSGNSVVVEVMVKTGSNYENKAERGLSHFLEHMLFEGTKNRPTNREISNEIEKVGGDFNAYTSNERTCFYIKVLKKHFSLAIDVLADVLQNALFEEKEIAKEKNVVINEINMINDEPKYYQWVLLLKSLFKRHPCRYPTYGSKEVIRRFKREKLLSFFSKYYLPDNMVVSIVGDAGRWREELVKRFPARKKGRRARISVAEPPLSRNIFIRKKKNIINTYVALGFKTVPRNHKDSYVLDVINGILGRGQSGKMFTEIRSKKGLAYDVGTQNVSERDFGYFAVYATIDRSNFALVKSLALKVLESLKSITEKELKEAQDYIEGDYLLEMEDSQKVADQMLYWELAGGVKLMDEYVKNIQKVSLADVKRVAGIYFKNYALVKLEGK